MTEKRENINEIIIARKVILYDGECGLCSGLVDFIGKAGRKDKFDFIPLQSEAGKKNLLMSGIPEDHWDSVVYLKEHEPLIRSTAILTMLRDLGGIWRLSYIFILVPEKIRDIIYRFVARKRYLISGRNVSCRCQVRPATKRKLILK